MEWSLKKIQTPFHYIFKRSGVFLNGVEFEKNSNTTPLYFQTEWSLKKIQTPLHYGSLRTVTVRNYAPLRCGTSCDLRHELRLAPQVATCAATSCDVATWLQLIE